MTVKELRTLLKGLKPDCKVGYGMFQYYRTDKHNDSTIHIDFYQDVILYMPEDKTKVTTITFWCDN